MDKIDASHLTAEEYERIMYVIKRDERLRRQEEQRILQLKAVSGEWMREFTRSASEKIRSPSSKALASCRETLGSSFTDSLKQSFKGFYSQSNSTEENVTKRCSEPTKEASADTKQRTRGMPPKLPTIDSSYQRYSPPGSGAGSSGGSQENSPKPPISPVMKVYQQAVDYMNTERKSAPPNEKEMVYRKIYVTSERKCPPKVEKEVLQKKTSNKLQDSSSSSDDEIESTHTSLCATKSSESTPSPRTPNSYKILSGIAHNQATAFQFPPSPLYSRPSSHERQSSDEFSTTVSSLRSRSTSSETNDESTSLAPQPLPRSRRISPLRKQQAIAEEMGNETISRYQYSATEYSQTSGADSGVSDCNTAMSPKLFEQSKSKEEVPQLQKCPSEESESSVNDMDGTVEKTTGYLFRKVTVKRRNNQNEHNTGEGNEVVKPSRCELQKTLVQKSKSEDDKSLGRKLRAKVRTSSGGTMRSNTGGVPHISVSDYSESLSNRGSVASPAESGRKEEELECATAYYSRSQTSLSSFGVRSESMSSIYSAAGGGRYGVVSVSGEILFSLSYNYKFGVLEVSIKECRNLAPVDAKRNRSDPYVKVYLLPDRTKAGKRKTKVKKHTLDPVFDEILKFDVSVDELENRTLWLSIWHSDIFGRNDFLGEVTLPLARDVFKDSNLRWFPLQDKIDAMDHCCKGNLFVALKYIPFDTTNCKRTKRVNKGTLHVMVKEAHNLMPTRSNGTADPFCKCYLLPDRSKTGKQKTAVIKKTCDPKWNHTFIYDDVNIDDLKDRCLELTVWDYDKLTSNDFLGGVRLSLGTGKHCGLQVDWMDSNGEEITLWQQMLERLDMWVYGELRLRPTLQSRH